jgi:hypothetical protein
MREEIRVLRRRVEDRLRKGPDGDIINVARSLGIDREGWVEIESSSSGDSVETVYGTLSHTNGHFSFSSLPKTFWFGRDISPLAGYVVSEGSAAVCSVAAFNIKRLEDEIKALIA